MRSGVSSGNDAGAEVAASNPLPSGSREERSEPSGHSFDPWTCSEEEARAASACDGCTAGTSIVAAVLHPRSPLGQWWAAYRLKALQPQAQRLRAFDALAGVALCVKHGLVVPDWLAELFLKRYALVADKGEGLQLNDYAAFGHPWPPNTHSAAERRRHAWMLEVVCILQQYRAKFPRRSEGDLWQAFRYRKSLPLPGGPGDDRQLGQSIAARIRRLDISRDTAEKLLDAYRKTYSADPRSIHRRELQAMEDSPHLSAWESLHGFAISQAMKACDSP